VSAPLTVTEQHYVLVGVIWLNEAPIRTVEYVRCATDPEGVWIVLRPGRDYSIIDAEHGQLYVSALVGTLIEVTYTVAVRPGTDARPRGYRALTVAANNRQGEHRILLTQEHGNGYDARRWWVVP
jgi:hypothetical protein